MANEGVRRGKIEEVVYDVLLSDEFVESRDQESFCADSIESVDIVLNLEKALGIRVPDAVADNMFGNPSFGGRRVDIEVGTIVDYLHSNYCDLLDD